MTPREIELIRVAYLGHHQKMKVLLNDGVNVNVFFETQDRTVQNTNGFNNIEIRNGYTPLMAACVKGHVRTIETLLSFGADINQCTHDDSPLSIALFNRRSDAVIKLLECGVDVNWQNRIGNTVLFETFKYHKGKTRHLLSLLLEYGANPNHTNLSGAVPILYELSNGLSNKEVIKLLLDYKADPYIKDHQDRDFFSYANILNQNDLIDFVKNYLDQIELNEVIEIDAYLEYSDKINF